MKNTIALILCSCIFLSAFAQLQVKPSCNFVVDILNGTVNGAKPNFDPAYIKKLVPCSTGEDPGGKDSKCGGAIYYKTQDLIFYTGRDYVEIGPGFKGKLSMPLMGARRNSLFKLLGNPKLKDKDWEAFETQYGCLVLYYNAANVVKKIQFSTVAMEALKLCQ